MPFLKSTETGIALISALLVVALATIVAVTMTTRQQLDIYRTANIINYEQAYVYALGGESWAKRILRRDDDKIDNLTEIWATPIPPLPIPGGTLYGQLHDLQGRFNLNNLQQDCQKQDTQLNSKETFERLLRVLDLSELSLKLVPTIMDWIDDDLETQFPFGAEDDAYLTEKPAYRTANTLFSSTSEIRMLTTLDNYTKLLPYVSTLPTCTAININTAPLPILLALVEGLSESDAEAIIATRKKTPFKSIEDFLAHNTLAGLTTEASSFAVASKYFLLTTEVQIDRSQIQLNSVFYRTPDKIKIIMRRQGKT